MASYISRILPRTFKSRLYSTRAKHKVDKAAHEYAKITELKKGLSMVTVDSNLPVARVTIAVKAGSRYENRSNAGVTHAIRHIAELDNDEISQFKLIKTVEETGGTLSVSTTRDYAFYTVECLREHVKTAVKVLGSIVNRTAFDDKNWHNNHGMASRIQHDLVVLHEQPNIELIEALHKTAYRETLGNSLYASSDWVGKHSPDMVVGFIRRHYTPDRMVLVGLGIDHEELHHIALDTISTQSNFTFEKKDDGSKPISVQPPNEQKAQYIGGEQYINRPLNTTFVAIATEGPSLGSKDQLAAAVLQHIMGTGSRVKNSNNSPGSRLGKSLSKLTDATFYVSGFMASYTDSGLFGFTASAEPQQVDKVLRAAFREFADLTKIGVTDAEVNMAKNQLKASILMSIENGTSYALTVAEQALRGNVMPTDDIVKMVNAISTADINAVAKKLANGKPTMVALGDLKYTPYLDQLLK